MPRDGTATRRLILEAALDVLRREGLDGFSVEAVARGAAVAKGLVIYHYGSRAALLERCGSALTRDRAARFATALARGRGIRGIDAAWEELGRQQRDGTTRAWLALAAAGVVLSTPETTELEQIARAGIIDGCAAALAAGVPQPLVREAYDALWLALLAVLEGDAD